MKSVLISIQPKWCELIASGKKTVEVRKTKPKLDTPFKCYIYCTDKKPSDNEWQYKPNLYLDKVENKVRWIDVEFTRTYNCEYLQQRVIGEFVCDKIVKFPHDPYDPAFSETADLSCVGIDGLSEYLGHKDYGYGWHITDLVVYDKPRELSEFYNYCNGLCFDNSIKYKCIRFNTDNPYACDHIKPLTRPPQSWCYVESGGT